MLWFRSFISALIICIFLTPTYAQDRNQDPLELLARLDLDNSLLARLDLGKETSPYQPKTKEREPLDLPDISSNLNLQLLQYRPHFPDYWTTYANRPHEKVFTRYKGFQGLINKEIKRVAHKYYKDLLKDYWSQRASLNPYDLDQEIRYYNLSSSDYGNRWWEQREFFYDHFPKEKGGASVVYYTVGENREIFSVGPLSLNNTGKVKWSNWRLTLSRDDEDEDLRTKDLRPDQQIQDSENSATAQIEFQTNPIIETGRRLAFGIKPPRGNLYTGSYFNISGSINLNVRLDTLSDNGSSIKGQIRFTGLWGVRKVPWCHINIEVTVKPLQEEYGATFKINLLQW